MATEILRPNSDTLAQLSQEPDSGSHYEKVDDVTPDDSSGYVYDDNPYVHNSKDIYGLPSYTGGAVITNVKLFCRVYRNSVSGLMTGYMKLKTHGTEYDTHLGNDTGWNNKETNYALNPNTESAWTVEELNALEIGCMLDVLDDGCVACIIEVTQMYAEVTYTVQELTGTVISVASSIQAAAIAGSGNAPLVAAPVAVVSSVQAAMVITSIQDLVASPVAVVSSIDAALVAGTGIVSLASLPISVASSVQLGTLFITQTLVASPIAVVASVQPSRTVIRGRPLTLIVITSQYRKAKVMTGFGG